MAGLVIACDDPETNRNRVPDGDTGWDGQVPCGPEEAPCTDDESCDLGFLCEAGACVRQTALEQWDFGGDWLMLTGFSIPTPADDCCHDLDGDGDNDNALLALLSTFDEYASESEKLEEAFNLLGVTLGMKVPEAPPELCGPVDLSLFVVTPDLDGDGIPETTFEQRRQGEGVYQIDPTSYDQERGTPVNRSPRSIWDGEVITTLPSQLSLTVPVGAGVRLQVGIEHLVVTLPIAELQRARAKQASEGGPLQVQAAVGGYVTVRSLVEEINRNISLCACNDEGTPLLSQPLMELDAAFTEGATSCEQAEGALASCVAALWQREGEYPAEPYCHDYEGSPGSGEAATCEQPGVHPICFGDSSPWKEALCAPEGVDPSEGYSPSCSNPETFPICATGCEALIAWKSASYRPPEAEEDYPCVAETRSAYEACGGELGPF